MSKSIIDILKMINITLKQQESLIFKLSDSFTLYIDVNNFYLIGLLIDREKPFFNVF